MTIPDPKRRTFLHSDEEAFSIKVLAFLADDPSRLDQFVAASGTMPSDMRAAMEEVSFRRGLLRFVDEDEELLRGFAAWLGSTPADVATALARLRRSDEDG